MSKKQETLDLLETLNWEEFKLRLDERLTSHHLVLWDEIELLKFTQGHDIGLLVAYIQDFNCMLTMVPLKDEYA
jgi:hypothetical protein